MPEAQRVARYWAARELTRIERADRRVTFRAPFACPSFTVSVAAAPGTRPRFLAGAAPPLSPAEAGRLLDLKSGMWFRDGLRIIACLDLPKGTSSLEI